MSIIYVVYFEDDILKCVILNENYFILIHVSLFKVCSLRSNKIWWLWLVPISTTRFVSFHHYDSGDFGGKWFQFSLAAGLIRLHMANTMSRNLACNEGECVSTHSQCQSLAPFMGNSRNHWHQKQHYNLQSYFQIHCENIHFSRIILTDLDTRACANSTSNPSA